MKQPMALGLLAALAGCKQGDGVDRSGGAIPEVVAARLKAGAITADGRLDEPAWRRAGRTGPFVDPRTGRLAPRSPVNAEARVAWDDHRLLLGFVVKDRSPTSPFKPGDVDPHVWERSSAVEVMIQPGDPGDNRHYYEVQVDVAGAIWDTRFDDYNRPITGGPGKRRFGHQEWESGLKPGIRVDGGSGRYTAELALPFSALSSRRAAVPPQPGDTWRLNFYSFRDGQRHALAWSPTLGQGNFHRSSRFGRVRFK